jgi:CarD family transcriptional regulator
LTKGRDISSILSFLSSSACVVHPDWKARFKENSEKMRSGDLRRTAEVMKSLLRLQCERPLSFREKKMLDSAHRMLVSEISIARGAPEPLASAVLQRALAKAGLQLPSAR